jgi:hypothetical protein
MAVANNLMNPFLQGRVFFDAMSIMCQRNGIAMASTAEISSGTSSRVPSKSAMTPSSAAIGEGSSYAPVSALEYKRNANVWEGSDGGLQFVSEIAWFLKTNNGKVEKCVVGL